MKPTVIECFAGAGGAALGLHRAGFQSLAHVEWDRDACSTLRAAVAAGLLDGDVVEGDVREVDWSRWPSPDLLWASPPCQDWSTAGKREGAKGERNGWPWTWDVVDQVKPTWLLAENVPGMLMHAGGADACKGNPDGCPACYTAEVLMPALRQRFAFAGYYVLDAADYGVPQHRNRVYFWGGPHPLPCPKPTHADPATVGQGGLFGPRLLPWVTVRQALGLGLETIGQTSPETAKGGNKWRSPDAPSVTIPALTTSGGWNGVHARMESGQGHRVTTSTTGRQRIEYTLRNPPENPRGPSDLVRRHEVISPDMPASTLTGMKPEYLLDPKHPPATPDAPAPSIRSGGDGHSAPPMWLDLERGAGMAERHGGRGLCPVDGPAPTLRARSAGAGAMLLRWLEDKDGRLAQSLDEPAPTLRAGGATDASGKMGGGSPHYIASRAGTEPWRLDAPAPCVAAGNGGKGCGQWSADAGLRAKMEAAAGRRRLTPEECATLQAFPPDWPFQGTKTATYRQIGNAVASPVAEALARQVLAVVE